MCTIWGSHANWAIARNLKSGGISRQEEKETRRDTQRLVVGCCLLSWYSWGETVQKAPQPNRLDALVVVAQLGFYSILLYSSVVCFYPIFVSQWISPTLKYTLNVCGFWFTCALANILCGQVRGDQFIFLSLFLSQCFRLLLLTIVGGVDHCRFMFDANLSENRSLVVALVSKARILWTPTTNKQRCGWWRWWRAIIEEFEKEGERDKHFNCLIGAFNIFGIWGVAVWGRTLRWGG